MLYLNPHSIMGISDEEAEIRLCYLYNILSKTRISQIDSDTVKTIFAFTRRLGKMERMKKSLEYLVGKFMGEGKFVCVPEDELEHVWTFSCYMPFSYRFYEDEEVGDMFSFYKVDNETQVNLMRCIFAGEIPILSRILENVFFSN